MQRADDPTAIAPDAAPPRPANGPISVAILAGIACVPLVIAAGFLADRPSESAAVAAVPSDISVLALRGQLDAAADRRPDAPTRAGY